MPAKKALAPSDAAALQRTLVKALAKHGKIEVITKKSYDRIVSGKTTLAYTGIGRKGLAISIPSGHGDVKKSLIRTEAQLAPIERALVKRMEVLAA